MLVMGKRICFPNDKTLKYEILGGAHGSKLVVYPNSTKMYKDLKIIEYVKNVQYVSR
jgi:hypothetical protein